MAHAELSSQFDAKAKEAAKLSASLDRLQEQLAASEAALSNEKAESTRIAEELARTFDDLAASRQNLSTRESELEATRQLAADRATRIGELDQTMSALNASVREQKEEFEVQRGALVAAQEALVLEHSKNVSSLEAQITSLAQELDMARRQLAAKIRQQRNDSSRAEGATKGLDETRAELYAARETIERLTAELTSTSEQLQKTSAFASSLQLGVERAMSNAAVLAEQLRVAKIALRGAAVRLSDATAATLAWQAAAATARVEVGSLTGALGDALGASEQILAEERGAHATAVMDGAARLEARAVEHAQHVEGFQSELGRLAAELQSTQHQLATRIRLQRAQIARAEALEAEVAAGVVSLLNMETTLLPMLARAEAAFLSEKMRAAGLVEVQQQLESNIEEHVEAQQSGAEEAVAVQEQLQETAAVAVEEKAAAEEAKVEAEEAKEVAVEEAKAAVEEAAAAVEVMKETAVALQTVCPPELKVRTPAHAKQLGRYVEFESRLTQVTAAVEEAKVEKQQIQVGQEGWHFAVYLFAHTQTFTKGRSFFSRSTENGPAFP